MDWTTYVRRTIGSDKQIDVAAKTGIDQTTISRWLNPTANASRRISSESVAKFARGYEVPVLEAFIVAGFLTEDEAGVTPRLPPALADIDTRELFRELEKRLAN